MEIKGQTCPENMERYLIRLINFDQCSAVHAVRRAVGAEGGTVLPNGVKVAV